MSVPSRFLVLGALAVSLLSAPGKAQHELVLENHTVLQGAVVSSTADSVTFDHVVGGKSVEVLTYPVDQIEPVSFYFVRRPAVANDAAATIALGKYCLHYGLNSRARDLFEAAEQLDPSKTAQISAMKAHSREASAAELLAQAKSDQASGDPYKALDTLEQYIRYFGDTPSGQKAKDLVKPFDAAYKARYTISQSKENAPEDKSELGRAKQMIATGGELATKALGNKELSESLQEYQQAVKEYERAITECDRLAKEHASDAALQKSVAALKTTAVNGAVQAHLNAAGIYMTRTAYQNALVEANQAIALDPDSNAAKSMRTRIATVSGLSGW